MTEKTGRTRRQPISAGLENADKITDARHSHAHLTPQRVDGRAERPYDYHSLFRRAFTAAEIEDGVVAPYYLPEVSGRRQVMVHASVENDEGGSTTCFDRAYSRDIDTRRARQKAAGFDNEMTLSEPGIGQRGIDQRLGPFA